MTQSHNNPELDLLLLTKDLHTAISDGRSDIEISAILKKCDPAKRFKLVNELFAGMDALTLAAQMNRPEIILLLLNNGAILEDKTLLTGLKFQSNKAVHAILNLMNIDEIEMKDITFLFVAAAKTNIDIFERLLQHHKTPITQIKDDDGATLFEMAKKNHNLGVIEYLKPFFTVFYSDETKVPETKKLSGKQLIAQLFQLSKKLDEIADSKNESKEVKAEYLNHIHYFRKACLLLNNVIIKRILKEHIDDYDKPEVKTKLAQVHDSLIKEFKAKLELLTHPEHYFLKKSLLWGTYTLEDTDKAIFVAPIPEQLNKDKKGIKELLKTLNIVAPEHVLKKNRKNILAFKPIAPLAGVKPTSEKEYKEDREYAQKVLKNYNEKLKFGINKRDFDGGIMVALQNIDLVFSFDQPWNKYFHEDFRAAYTELLFNLVDACKKHYQPHPLAIDELITHEEFKTQLQHEIQKLELQKAKLEAAANKLEDQKITYMPKDQELKFETEAKKIDKTQIDYEAAAKQLDDAITHLRNCIMDFVDDRDLPDFHVLMARFKRIESEYLFSDKAKKIFNKLDARKDTFFPSDSSTKLAIETFHENMTKFIDHIVLEFGKGAIFGKRM